MTDRRPDNPRRKGAPGFDDLHGFWHDRQAPKGNRFANGFVNALTITALIACAIAILWLMIDTAFASPTRPAACADYHAEIVACAEGIRR